MRWGYLIASALAIVLSACQPTLPPTPISLPSGPASVDGVPEPLASRIVDVALTHASTASVHAGQQFEVTEVSAVDAASFGGTGSYGRVVIEFADPLPFDVWPDEAVCGIGRASDEITGIAWLVSLETETVEAYSPQWDYAVACV